MDAGQVLRTVRATVFAVVCVLAAALGHLVMSGMPVPTSTLLAALAVAAVGAWCCAGRERGPVAVGLLTVGTQAVLHTAFSFGQTARSSDGSMGPTGQWAKALLCGPGRTRLSESDAARVVRDAGLSRHLHQGAAPAMAGHGQHDVVMHGNTAGMVAAHLLVALLSAWWLCGGERAAFRLARAAAVRLFAPLIVVFAAAVPDAPPSAGPLRETPRRTVRELLLAHSISLRGPPSGPAVG
ncbi:PE-PGRS family protein [Streptomyces sp. NPDC021115]